MQALTIISFLFFTGLVGVLTYWITRRDDLKSTKGFFLAGRTLTFPLIAGSLLLTNLSTEQLVALNGAAFNDGLCVMVWEVFAVLALVVMALFFLPRWLKSGVTTVPEFLEIRFDRQTQVIANLIFLIAYVGILLPIILYTGATGMIGILDLKELMGIESDEAALPFVVFLVGIVGSVYALSGGLRSVAVSDTINGIGLLVGGLLITFLHCRALVATRVSWEGSPSFRTASETNSTPSGPKKPASLLAQSFPGSSCSIFSTGRRINRLFNEPWVQVASLKVRKAFC